MQGFTPLGEGCVECEEQASISRGRKLFQSETRGQKNPLNRGVVSCMGIDDKTLGRDHETISPVKGTSQKHKEGEYPSPRMS